jgi:undecaprenol kinase
MSSMPSSDNVIVLNTHKKQANGLPVLPSAPSDDAHIPAGVRNPFKAKHFLASVGFALEGLQYITRAERNFRIDLCMAGICVVLGLAHQITLGEWIALTVVCGLVLFAEAANTAIELVVDMITQGEFDARAKSVKDVAAGACLMCAGVAAVVGGLVFVPRWLDLLF